jgi:hypothetical protein
MSRRRPPSSRSNGSANGNARFTEPQVRAIRVARLIDHQPISAIAREHGAWPGTVSRICRWLDWAHSDHDLRGLPRMRLPGGKPPCTDPEVLEQRRERRRQQDREAQRRHAATTAAQKRAKRAAAAALREELREAAAREEWAAKAAAGYVPHYQPVTREIALLEAPHGQVVCAGCRLWRAPKNPWESPCSIEIPEARAAGQFASRCPSFFAL